MKIQKNLQCKISKEINRLGFVEIKKKINLAIRDLDVFATDEQVDRLVRLRNTIAAHGSSKQNISNEELYECKLISKSMVLKYLEKYK